MTKNCKNIISLSFLILLTLFVGVNANTNDESNLNSSENNSLTAILSFVNYSGSSKAVKGVMQVFYEQLDSNNINYLSPSDLRPTLRKHRIRNIGFINKNDVLHISKATNIDRIIVGSINIYEDKQNPELSISIRIIDTEQMTIISAINESATGKDFEKLFGVGKIESIKVLTQQIVKDLVTKLAKDINNYDNQLNQLQFAPTIALIPFDNISEKKNAGLITTNILISTLVQEGYNIIEPGIINEIMIKNKRILRGEIDYITLEKIKSELQIDLIITGSVDNFKLSRGQRQSELELGVRTLDAANGKIIDMFYISIKGNDSESIFGLGKINSMGNLISKSFNKFIHILEKKSEKYFAKQN